MNPPEAVHGLIEKARIVRNLEEHRELAARDFLREVGVIDITRPVLEWAMTCTPENGTPDEYKAAQWIIGRTRGQG